MIVSHLLVLAVAATLVSLGQWQLDRLRQVRDNNALLEARLALPPASLAELATEEAVLDAAELEFRRVEARGVYRPEQEVLQRNRTHLGQQGFHVLTPLVLTDAAPPTGPDGPAEGDELVVLVRRGWVPATHADPPVAAARPPEGEVVVTGILERPVAQPGVGARDPDEGRLERVFHADTTRLAAQVDGHLLGMILRLEEQAPAAADTLPMALDRPVLDEANHLSYAIQWHAFALLALGTYAAWLRSRGRRAPRRPLAAEDGTDPSSDAGGRATLTRRP